MSRALAVLGTASDVGKSVVVTALCRIFTNMGIKTAPFKAQNMSNNSFVTADQKEIGRAQAVQAFACRVLPTVDMNPVLLKPSRDKIAQVIIHGKSIGNMDAAGYFHNTDFAFGKAMESMKKLKQENDLIVIEGAGSCAEVNLRNKDFVNFKTAEAANANVILVADIDKGGVFAQIIGTLECITKKERELVKGIIINKFRGDRSLFYEGVDFIEKKTGIPVLGVIPYFGNIEIEYEDGLPDQLSLDSAYMDKNKINIAILKLPHMSNFTDFLPFNMEQRTQLHFLFKPKPIDDYDVLFIPGSKSVIYDTIWIKQSGWESFIKHYIENGGYVFGICGGYQIMGNMLKDPFSIESDIKSVKGLCLFNGISVIETTKQLTHVQGMWMDGNIEIKGYEIHMGKTILENEKVAIRIFSKDGKKEEGFDGVLKDKVSGCYLHGIFDNHIFRHYFLKKIARNKLATLNKEDYWQFRNKQYELLAEHFKSNLDMNKLLSIAGF